MTATINNFIVRPNDIIVMGHDHQANRIASVSTDDNKNNNSSKELLSDSCIQSSSMHIANFGFLERLANIMADEAVRAFFRDYFSQWSDGKTSLLLIHTYNLIEEAYAKQHNGEHLPTELIAPLIKSAISNSACRRVLCKTMLRYLEDDMTPFAQLLASENLATLANSESLSARSTAQSLSFVEN